MKALLDLEGQPSTPRVVHAVGHIVSPPRLLDGWPDWIDATRIAMAVRGPERSIAPVMFSIFLPMLRSVQEEIERACAVTVSKPVGPSVSSCQVTCSLRLRISLVRMGAAFLACTSIPSPSK